MLMRRVSKKAAAAAVKTGVPNKKLERIRDKWLKILKLEAPKWKNVTITYQSEEDMRGNVGLCLFSKEHGIADVYILEPAAFMMHQAETGQSEEEVVVHELLHLLIDGHRGCKGKYDPQHESNLNDLAAALVRRHK